MLWSTNSLPIRCRLWQSLPELSLHELSLFTRAAWRDVLISSLPYKSPSCRRAVSTTLTQCFSIPLYHLTSTKKPRKYLVATSKVRRLCLPALRLPVVAYVSLPTSDPVFSPAASRIRSAECLIEALSMMQTAIYQSSTGTYRPFSSQVSPNQGAFRILLSPHYKELTEIWPRHVIYPWQSQVIASSIVKRHSLIGQVITHKRNTKAKPSAIAVTKSIATMLQTGPSIGPYWL
jgi:hypothetical protein